MQKSMHFVLHFYMHNQCTLRYVVFTQKSRHSVLHVYMQKNALCVPFLYLKLIA